MKEINDLNEEEYSKLEEEVLDMFSKLKESIDNKNKDTFNVNENKDKSSIKGSLNGNKGLKEITKFDKVFFNGSIAPKYIYHKGYNAKNYIIINGKLDNPAKFMNILLNKILNEYIEFCIVTPYKDKLKANIKFEKKEEDDDDDEEEKKKKEEEDRLKKEEEEKIRKDEEEKKKKEEEEEDRLKKEEEEERLRKEEEEKKRRRRKKEKRRRG